MNQHDYEKRLGWSIGEELQSPHFTGKVFSNPLIDGYDCQAALITFEPNCINDYHAHHGAEQTLICIGGQGFYQEEGKEIIVMTPGTAIVVPNGVKHWHGATEHAWFSHIVIYSKAIPKDTEWLETVPQDIYKVAQKSIPDA